MNSHLLEHQPTNGTSVLKLVEEMKFLGLDPSPLLEIAANDIFIRHGAKALIYAEEMLCQMLAGKDPDGIYLWQALYHILGSYGSEPILTMH